MSTRRRLIAALTEYRTGVVPTLADADHAEQLVDAHRAEVLAEAKHEVIAWLVKKAREQTMQDAGRLASKVDRGAVRIFLGTGHYWDAMDAHRAQVLAEDGQAYTGELAMLRGLLGTLLAVAEHGDLTDVRKLLEEHQADDAAARVHRTRKDGRS